MRAILPLSFLLYLLPFLLYLLQLAVGTTSNLVSEDNVGEWADLTEVIIVLVIYKLINVKG